MQTSFVTVVGYVLGILVVLVLAGICLKPMKYIMRIFINSVLGGVLLFVINLLGHLADIHIGINPVTSVLVGALGVPGVIGLLILQIFY